MCHPHRKLRGLWMRRCRAEKEKTSGGKREGRKRDSTNSCVHFVGSSRRRSFDREIFLQVLATNLCVKESEREKHKKKKVRRTSTVPRTLFPRPLAPLYVPLVFYVAPKRRIDRRLGVPWCFFVKRNVNPCSPRSRDEILICTTNHALIVNERSNRARELRPRSRIAGFSAGDSRFTRPLLPFPSSPPPNIPVPPYRNPRLLKRVFILLTINCKNNNQ